MPGVDLSSLNSPEMRRLLAAAEARHNHVLAEQLRGELARRGARVRALPREPTTFVTGSFDEVWGLEPAEAEARPKAAPRRRVAAAILGAVGAAAVAIVVGWQLARSGAETPPRPKR